VVPRLQDDVRFPFLVSRVWFPVLVFRVILSLASKILKRRNRRERKLAVLEGLDAKRETRHEKRETGPGAGLLCSMMFQIQLSIESRDADAQHAGGLLS